jgi:hypothetical protein
MKHEVIEPIRGNSDDLLVGGATWAVNEQVLKYGWNDKRGRYARGGELPFWIVRQAIELLVREGYLLAQEVLEAVAPALRTEQGVTDLIAAVSP